MENTNMLLSFESTLLYKDQTAKGIEKFILDWLNKVINDDSEFQKISSSKAVEKDKNRIKEVQSKKSELLGNKKATEHKLNNIMNIIESNSGSRRSSGSFLNAAVSSGCGIREYPHLHCDH